MARSLLVVPFALAGVSGILGSLAFNHHAASVEHVNAPTRGVQLNAPAAPSIALAPPPIAAAPSAFSRLAPIRFSNENSQQSATVRLYDLNGRVDEAEATRLDALLCDTRDPQAWATLTLDRRTLQLAVRAAAHFHVAEVRVVSAYRKAGRRREGLHASGKAIDFKLPGVAPRLLAAYLRTLARVGVGVYTHPKTAYVHLDDREHSFHWLDASPPGRSWRELSLGGSGLAQRDAAYVRADDWPEGTPAPASATSSY